ncbi:hypothetical protein AC1031_018802 [Aphanomyces cochlioides]|nr:hypothetical protein AC1031_018802 [Aphanomyces cochlioides]
MTASIVRGWEWAMHALWAEGDMKCNVRVVDTVLMASGQPTRWLFASKHGTIAKKKDDHLDLSSIRDRFLRLSMHPRNPNSYVAHALFRNGSRILVNAAQLDELLFETPTKSRGLLGLQAHVVSAAHETLVASVKGSQCSVSSVGEPVSPRLRKEIELAATEIVRFLEATAHVSVAKLDAEFAVDEDNVLWLVHLAQVTTSDKKLVASQSLPTLHALEKSDGAGSKCRGEFCRVACQALPGLFPSAIAPQTPPLEDTGQRFKIGYNNIALARLEMHFLHANPASNPDVALEWAAFDAAQRTELGRSNPSHFYKLVGVCPNCNRIYAHLQTLRQNHFRHPDADDHRLEAPRQDVKKSKKKAPSFLAKGGPLWSNNVEKSATDDVMPALQLSQDQQHEAAFLAELAKHATPRRDKANAPPPEEEDAAPPLHERPPPKRKDGKKRAKGPQSADNQPNVLAHFEAEWNQVESANRSLVQENHDLRTQLELHERQYVQSRSSSELALDTATNAIDSRRSLRRRSRRTTCSRNNPSSSRSASPPCTRNSRTRSRRKTRCSSGGSLKSTTTAINSSRIRPRKTPRSAAL